MVDTQPSAGYVISSAMNKYSTCPVHKRVTPRLFSWPSTICVKQGVVHLKVDLRSKGPLLQLGLLQAGELHYSHLCIALDLVVQFKLYSGICTWTHVWVHVQLGSSAHIAPSELMTSINKQSCPVWWETETNIAYFYFRLSHSDKGKLLGV